MRDRVAAELDGGVLHDDVAQGVAQGVVLVVELEGGGRFGGAGELWGELERVSDVQKMGGEGEGSRGSAL